MLLERYKTIYSVIDLIYWSSKIFGMAPFARENRGFASTMNVSGKGFVNMFIGLGVCATMLFFFVQLVNIRQEQGFFNQVNTILYILSGLRVLSAMITVFVLFFSQEPLISSYEKLDNFDNKKKTFKKLQYTKYFNGTLFSIFFIFFLVLGMEVMYYFVMEEKISVLICDLFSNGLQFLIHLLVLLYFELYIFILTNDFKFIKSTTEDLNKAFKETDHSQKETILTVKTISLMYDDLCKGAEYINQVFSFPLFSLISLNFMEVLLGIYLCQDHKTRDVRAIFWTAFYTVQQFFILTPPGTAESEAKEITKYLSEAELHIDEELSNERNHFLLRTLHQSVSFSACGFFPISMSAIIGQFSISISFLLFMFQIIK
ncbi:hypothetical protein ILUMI_06352 [Ignelater luminosus]|uniref:Gustatory receptor n=1 Tax=Ignelater luminosus TaxID=2038154 RepID=A0A8K0GCN7_IGNLU|nr:hypothetical protein ILUMI_06352 [Ignelater luminosus]